MNSAFRCGDLLDNGRDLLLKYAFVNTRSISHPGTTDSARSARICIGSPVRPLAIAALLAGAGFLTIKARTHYAEAEASLLRIPVEEVEVSDVSQYGDTVEARVRNRSTRFTLTSVQVKLTVWDELPDGSSELVAEDNETARLNVPPGQARKLRFPHGADLPRPIGPRQWIYSVVTTRGEFAETPRHVAQR